MMSIANAFKLFVSALIGKEPVGKNIADVIRDSASKIANKAVMYGDEAGKSIVLKSSTASSVKEFTITVDDSGTITATQVPIE